jgi:creatinine amidohydrolase/Fe(II)-dependent formamide hydrolase-like protein
MATVSHTMEQASKEHTTIIAPVGSTDPHSEHDHLEKALQSLSAGIARIERKLDRILALAVESRGRSRL